jgi:hypothetical protein
LSGEILYELTQLNFLSIFDVSYNNLYGTPPITGQFADFDEKICRGNLGLCGPLLKRKCEGVESSPSSQSNHNEEKETGVGMITFYWSILHNNTIGLHNNVVHQCKLAYDMVLLHQ